MSAIRIADVFQAENRVYGHASVLARYAGLSGEPWIPGALQHGWNPYDGIGGYDGLWRTSLTKYVWGSNHAARGMELGGRRYVAIGAPWLYLMRLPEHRDVSTPDNLSSNTSTLVYPFHATVHTELLGSHTLFARDVAEQESGRSVTVCLHPIDYASVAARKAYEEQGFTVVTNGGSSAHHPEHTRFLDRQLKLIRDHSRVVSNRLCTAILYGAAAGRSIGIYGSDMSLKGQRPYPESDIPRMWPEMHVAHVPAATAREIAEQELGAANVLEPTAIRTLFGWSPHGGLQLPRGARFSLARTIDLGRINAMGLRRAARHFRAY